MLYYHHRTPQLIQKDIKQLSRLPNHLSVILENDQNDRLGGLDALIDDVAEIACWCASAGIPMLSVYEKTGGCQRTVSLERGVGHFGLTGEYRCGNVGVLKGYITASHRAIAQRLHAYFGKERPTLRVRAPHSPAFANGDTPNDSGELKDTGMECLCSLLFAVPLTWAELDLEILFISEDDGRESLVDLTRTLCEMAQKGKISADDVTQDLIDAEVSGMHLLSPFHFRVSANRLILNSPSTGTLMTEPDMLIIFAPHLHLQGYPPWQIRLTEFLYVSSSPSHISILLENNNMIPLYSHLEDNEGVGYQAFLRALYKYAMAEMKFGR